MSTHSRLQRGVNPLGSQLRGVVNRTPISPLVETLMRLGFIVRGVIYAVIGLLAFQVAASRNGSLTDPQGAIVTLSKTGLGNVLLYAILVGLIGYALWGVIRAVFDPYHRGTSAEGIAARIGYMISGASYAFLAIATYGLITGGAQAARNGAQTAQAQQTTATILSYSWGPWVVGIVGVILMGAGLVQFVQGLQDTFEQQFDAFALSAEQRKWIDRMGRFGTAARGVVYTLIGLFLFLAAYHHDPQQAQGIDGVLTALLHQAYGPWLLAVVALGLIAFGVYSAMDGIWLRFKR